MGKIADIVNSPEFAQKSPLERAQARRDLFAVTLDEHPEIKGSFDSADDDGKQKIVDAFKTKLDAEFPQAFKTPGYSIELMADGRSMAVAGGKYGGGPQTPVYDVATEQILHAAADPANREKFAALPKEQRHAMAPFLYERLGPDGVDTELFGKPEDFIARDESGATKALKFAVPALLRLGPPLVASVTKNPRAVAVAAGLGDAAAQTVEQQMGTRTKFSATELGLNTVLSMMPAATVAKFANPALNMAARAGVRAAEGAAQGAVFEGVRQAVDEGKLEAGRIGLSSAFGAGLGSLVGAFEPKIAALLAGKNADDAIATLKTAAEKATPEDRVALTAAQRKIEETIGVAQPRSAEYPANKQAELDSAFQSGDLQSRTSAMNERTLARGEGAAGLKQDLSEEATQAAEFAARKGKVVTSGDVPILTRGEATGPRLVSGATDPLGARMTPPAEIDVGQSGTVRAASATPTSEPGAIYTGSEISNKRASEPPPDVTGAGGESEDSLPPDALTSGQAGFISKRLMTSFAGGTAGAVYGGSQGQTPEEKLKLAALYGAAGLAIGYGGSSALGLAVRGGRKVGSLLANPTLAKQLWAQGRIKDALTYTADAADTKAIIAANEASNEVGHAIERAFPKDQRETARIALSFMRESGNDPAKLDEMARTLASSAKADPEWRNTAIDAVAFAKAHGRELTPISELYQQLTDAQMLHENVNGVDTLDRPNYVMHAQDIETPMANPLAVAKASGTAAQFRKVRTYDTFADSIAAGIDPKSLDAVDLLHARTANGNKLVNRQAWVKGLASYTDPISGTSIVAPLETITRADGSTYRQPPQGYDFQRAGNMEFALNQNYSGIFTALNDPSAWAKTAAGSMALRINSAGKSLRLLIDTFHLGRVMLMEGAAKLNAAGLNVDEMHAPVPAFVKNRGATILDNSIPELSRIAHDEGWAPAQLTAVIADKKRLSGLVDAGMNVGGVSDALHADIIHSLPIVGDFNKWLFGQYQRGAMSEVALLEHDRQSRMYPNLSPAELNRKVADNINVWFRNLGRQGLLQSRTALDTARFLFLAPQWNEGAIRQELGAVKEGVQTAIDVVKGKQFASGLLLRAAGTMLAGQFIANQVLNIYTRGHPTWDNPEEGVGAKISAWIPDKIGGGSGFFLNPMGIAAEISHLLIGRYEKTASFRRSLIDFAHGRLSAVMQPLYTFAFGRNGLGQPLRDSEVGKETLKAAMPLPLPTDAVTGTARSLATGERQEQFAGQFQKQLLSSFGVRTEQAPSPVQRMQALAREFNQKKGITPSAEFYSGDYQPLAQALTVGNSPAAKTALEELLRKRTVDQVVKHFSSAYKYPFTGNTAREVEFFRGLNPEQQKAYREARAQRMELAKKAINAVVATVREQRAAGKN